MSIIRVSAADLFTKPHDLSSEEKAALAGLTDEEIEQMALADPDAPPPTPDMIRRGHENRRSRLRLEALRDRDLGARLTRAAPDLDLPVFEVTDEHGRTLLIKAAKCRPVTLPHDPAIRVLTLQAVVGQASPSPSDDAKAHARSPETQTT